MAGNDQGEDRRSGRGKRKEPAVAYFSKLTLATGSNSSSNTSTSNSGTKNRHDLIFVPTPSVRTLQITTFRTACTVCKKEFKSCRIYMNAYVLCPYCNGPFLASVSRPNIKNSTNQSSSLFANAQISEPQRLPGLFSTSSQGQYLERMNDLDSKIVPIVDFITPRQQHEHAVKHPDYFYYILESASIIYGRKPHPIPEFQGQVVDLHRVFVGVTSRGGICKVAKEGRLQEVCATLPQNLVDWFLYDIYFKVLYEYETLLCNFPYEEHIPPNPPLGAHLMAGVNGGQPSQQVQPSFPDLDSALANNNQLWTGSQNGINFNLADHPSSSFHTAHPMQGLIRGQPSQQVQPSFPDLDSALVNNQREPASSLPLPDTGAVAPPESELDTSPPETGSPSQYLNLTDSPQNFASAVTAAQSSHRSWDPNEGQVQPLPQMREVQDVSSTGIDPPHNQPMIVKRKRSTESRDGNHDEGASSASNMEE